MDPAATPAHEEMVTISEEDYRRAGSLMSWNLRDKVLRSNISPNWIDGDRFWYRTRTEDGSRFYRVDPDARERSHAFDHERLAEALTETLGEALDKTISADDLPFTTFRYIHDETALFFGRKESSGSVTWRNTSARSRSVLISRPTVCCRRTKGGRRLSAITTCGYATWRAVRSSR